MKCNKKLWISTLILTTLLACTLFVSSVSAQENLKASDKPSQLEQGLIDALNSNKKNLPTDDVVANYCKVNKDKIPIPKKDTSGSTSLRTYQLNDGSDITFTNQSFFFVTSMKTEPNNKTVIQNNTAARGSITPQYYQLSYTNTITASQSFYNFFGTRLFTVNSKGYYGYNISPAIVQSHYSYAWYTLGTPTIFQVRDWSGAGVDYSNGPTSEIYGSGHFHWGFEVSGVGLVIYDKYIKVYSTCDKFGNVHRRYVMQ